MSQDLETNVDVTEEVTEKKRSKKWLFIAAAIILILGIGSGLYYNHYQNVKAEEKAEKKKTLTMYKVNLALVVLQSSNAGVKAEKMVNQYQEVWHSAIFNDRYTTSDGVSHSYGTFSQAIADQKLVYESKGELTAIKSSMEEVERTMESLKNPPSQFKDLYKEVVNMYTTLSSFIGMAENPTGSLQTFTQEANSMDTQLAQKIESIRVQLPK